MFWLLIWKCDKTNFHCLDVEIKMHAPFDINDVPVLVVMSVMYSRLLLTPHNTDDSSSSAATRIQANGLSCNVSMPMWIESKTNCDLYPEICVAIFFRKSVWKIHHIRKLYAIPWWWGTKCQDDIWPHCRSLTTIKIAQVAWQSFQWRVALKLTT